MFGKNTNLEIFFHPIVISEIFSFGSFRGTRNFLKKNFRNRALNLENLHRSKKASINNYIPEEYRYTDLKWVGLDMVPKKDYINFWLDNIFDLDVNLYVFYLVNEETNTYDSISLLRDVRDQITTEMVKLLLEHPNSRHKISLRNYPGHPIFFYSIMYENRDMTDLLINHHKGKYQLFINYQHPVSGSTAYTTSLNFRKFTAYPEAFVKESMIKYKDYKLNPIDPNIVETFDENFDAFSDNLLMSILRHYNFQTLKKNNTTWKFVNYFIEYPHFKEPIDFSYRNLNDESCFDIFDRRFRKMYSRLYNVMIESIEPTWTRTAKEIKNDKGTIRLYYRLKELCGQ